MTPRHADRAAGLVTGWVRWYTRRLPAPIAQRRVDEITSDLHDHIAYGRAAGASDRRIALSILSRMARGLPADASWRGRIRPWRGDLMKSLATTIAAAVALAVLGVLAFMYGASDDAPGLSLIGLLLIAGGLVIGVRATLRRARR
jgi:hypothetical protein